MPLDDWFKLLSIIDIKANAANAVDFAILLQYRRVNKLLLRYYLRTQSMKRANMRLRQLHAIFWTRAVKSVLTWISRENCINGPDRLTNRQGDLKRPTRDKK